MTERPVKHMRGRLSAEYCRMARERIAADATLFSEVVMAEPRPSLPAAPQLELQL